MQGTSGYGRSSDDLVHFSAMTENAFPYKTEGHRHRPEIEQELAALGSPAPGHLRPAPAAARPGRAGDLLRDPRRADLEGGGPRRSTRERYADEPFVHVLDGPPNLRAVRDTNECHVYVTVEERGRVMAFSAIDNIWKGASSQGVQNLNLMLGLDETEGLRDERGDRGTTSFFRSRWVDAPDGVEELDPAPARRPASAPAAPTAGSRAAASTDVGLLVCDAEEVSSAMVLTRNASAAAPIRVCRERCDRGPDPRRGRQQRQRQRRDRRAGLRRRAGDVRADAPTQLGLRSRAGRGRRDRHDRRAAADRRRPRRHRRGRRALSRRRRHATSPTRSSPPTAGRSAAPCAPAA